MGKANLSWSYEIEPINLDKKLTIIETIKKEDCAQVEYKSEVQHTRVTQMGTCAELFNW